VTINNDSDVQASELFSCVPIAGFAVAEGRLLCRPMRHDAVSTVSTVNCRICRAVQERQAHHLCLDLIALIAGQTCYFEPDAMVVAAATASPANGSFEPINEYWGSGQTLCNAVLGMIKMRITSLPLIVNANIFL
jgi:hypothetical protein